MRSLSVRTLAFVVVLALGLVVLPGTAAAQYQVTNLVENLPNKAPHTDPNLVNAWGIARSSTGPFWASDNGTGLSTLYDGMGNPQSLVVTIPSAAGGPGSPSGIVFNGSNDFVVSQNGLSGQALFVFAANDGTISGWSPSVAPTNAIIAYDNSKAGAVYTGLAISSGKNGNFLYAADTANNRVDVYDGSFRLIKTLTDPTIPEGFTAYGIQDINSQVYVTFASTGNAPGGFIDIFTEQGTFVKRFAQGGTLNQPWGMTLAPINFGSFSTALLVSNNLPEGTINAFNAKTGKFLGQLKDSSGKVIHIDQLWGIEFGGGSTSNGAVNQLFFTAGPSNYQNGLFGTIQFVGK
jgi:uncharacterized protein (TIGR03118 family)